MLQVEAGEGGSSGASPLACPPGPPGSRMMVDKTGVGPGGGPGGGGGGGGDPGSGGSNSSGADQQG